MIDSIETSTQTEAVKLEETALCFHGKLPEQQPDEANMPTMERAAKMEILEDNESVKALVMVPKRTLDCK